MSVDTLDTIKNLADLGGTVILTVMLYLLWVRLNTVTDRIIDILQTMREETPTEE